MIDTIKLPKGFDIDDIYISHDSEYSETNEEDGQQLTNILQTVIDELLEQSNKKIKDEDI